MAMLIKSSDVKATSWADVKLDDGKKVSVSISKIGILMRKGSLLFGRKMLHTKSPEKAARYLEMMHEHNKQGPIKETDVGFPGVTSQELLTAIVFFLNSKTLEKVEGFIKKAILSVEGAKKNAKEAEPPVADQGKDEGVDEVLDKLDGPEGVDKKSSEK